LIPTLAGTTGWVSVAQLLVPPERLGQLGFSAEALIHVGTLLATQADSAARFAATMALLMRSAPHPATLSALAPSSGWVGWDHPAAKLWPAPDDRLCDLNDQPVDRRLDEIAEAVRTQLLALDRPVVIGHSDWSSQNLRWVDRHLHVVHDWDSVVAQPEAAIAGQAAAIWPGIGLPGEVATVAQSERFLVAYERASRHSWTVRDVRAAWAAGLWTRAFDAKGEPRRRRSRRRTDQGRSQGKKPARRAVTKRCCHTPSSCQRPTSW
jgi:hypothetical protein